MVTQKEAREYKRFYSKVLKHLENTKQAFCMTNYGIISREDCSEYLSKTKEVK